MFERKNQPVLLLLTSHWITMAGVTLVTLGGFAWLFVLTAHVSGHVDNPYIGLLVFIAIPIVFFAGLILIPVGIAITRRRIRKELEAVPDRKTAWRRAGLFFGLMTVANVILGSQLTYRAVDHLETVQFCGQSCHVMKPEFTAHLLAPHQQVACASCHISPGAAGWVHAKMAGTHQLFSVIFNSYPRPIESGLESNRLVSSASTCEECHAREKVIGPRLRIVTKYKDDEANTRTETVLTMMVGGGRSGGIHGAHMGPGVTIRYAAQDKKRQIIPWVEYRNAGITKTYVASDAKGNTPGNLPVFEMQCVDCHNRPAHSFESADHAIDGAIRSGEIAADLPFVKKTGVALIKTAYQTDEEASQRIPTALRRFYREKYPDIESRRTSDIQAASQTLLSAYRNNVFPDLKVSWGTYPNNLGHVDDPGCFRCHDDSHASSDKKTITQDCNACHQAVAVEESSPEVLKTLGIADTLAKK